MQPGVRGSLCPRGLAEIRSGRAWERAAVVAAEEEKDEEKEEKEEEEEEEKAKENSKLTQ
jgi:hypothetical protein